jgi:hypothetical protein
MAIDGLFCRLLTRVCKSCEMILYSSPASFFCEQIVHKKQFVHMFFSTLFSIPLHPDTCHLDDRSLSKSTFPHHHMPYYYDYLYFLQS